jgi:hypothetical protein
MMQRTDEVEVAGRQLTLTGRWLRIARLSQEWFEDVEDPPKLVADLDASRIRPDIFTFWQRPPTSVPLFQYHLEWEQIAVLPVTTFDNWYRHQINNKTRNLIVKAQKRGVEVRPATFDDSFVRGMTAIFNETPLRQERPYLHYGKSFETIKRDFARYLFREQLIGAYLGNELIGFIMLADGGSFGYLGQIISLIRHRDKSPTNALMAKAVEVCAQRGWRYLVYALWPRGPLRDFKRHNGFECVRVPRYYVPLTLKGRLALRLGLHRALADWLPESTLPQLKAARFKFYSLLYSSKTRIRDGT